MSIRYYHLASDPPRFCSTDLPTLWHGLQLILTRGERGDPGNPGTVCLAADPLANEYPIVVWDCRVQYYKLACTVVHFSAQF